MKCEECVHFKDKGNIGGARFGECSDNLPSHFETEIGGFMFESIFPIVTPMSRCDDFKPKE